MEESKLINQSDRRPRVGWNHSDEGGSEIHQVRKYHESDRPIHGRSSIAMF